MQVPIVAPGAAASGACPTEPGIATGTACRESRTRLVSSRVSVLPQSYQPATGKVVEGGIVPETERVFQNLSAVLKAAGKSFDDVVRAGVFLTNMTDFAAMNGIYSKYFSQPFPARTTIAAAALPLGACVEIDLVVKA